VYHEIPLSDSPNNKKIEVNFSCDKLTSDAGDMARIKADSHHDDSRNCVPKRPILPALSKTAGILPVSCRQDACGLKNNFLKNFLSKILTNPGDIG